MQPQGWHAGMSLCQAVFSESLMASQRREEEKSVAKHDILQDEQMAEPKCGDLFYISIPCCCAVDVGFRFLFPSSNVILQDNGHTQCLS